MFSKEKHVVIEMDNERLKMIHFLSGGRKTKILHIAIKDIIDSGEEQIAESIVKFLNDWKARMDKVYVSISRQQITTRNLKLPSSNQKEISEMVDLQLNKLTPYSREEIITDLQIIEVEGGYSKILLSIIHRDIVNRLQKVMRLSAVWPEEYFLSSEGINLIYLDKKGFHKEKIPIGIIDLDYKWSDFVIFKEGKLLFTRNLSIGRTHLDLLEGDYKEKFIDEIKRLIEVYSNSDIDGEIRKIVLCGASGDLPDIVALIKQNLNIEVETYPTSIEIELELSPEKTALESIQKLVSFSSLIGLGFNLSLIKINLTPQEIKLEKRLISRGKEIMTMGVLIFFTIILGMAIFFENLYFRKKNYQYLADQFKSRESEVEVIDKKFNKVNLIRERVDFRLSVLNIISAIYKNIPNNLYITVINYDNRKGLILRGYSEDAANIFTFVNQMEGSALFNQVKTTYMTKRKVADIERTDFELISLFEVENLEKKAE